jgi:hypothetical protein
MNDVGGKVIGIATPDESFFRVQIDRKASDKRLDNVQQRSAAAP